MTPIGKTLGLLSAASVLLFVEPRGWAEPPRPAPEFILPERDAGTPVSLSQFQGKILILDFFAYWCTPCRTASASLETDIQRYYANRGGNPFGVPVQVVSVNIEAANPDKTKEFIRRSGAEFVVNDPGATLLKKFQVEGIPYLVIIDGTRAQSSSGPFTVVYQHAGYEGADSVRRVVDELGRPIVVTSAVPSAPPPASQAVPVSLPVEQSAAVDTEILTSGDLLLTDTSIRFRRHRQNTDLSVNVGYSSFDVDYRPYALFDFIGSRVSRHEDRPSGQLLWRQRVSPQWSVSASGGGYRGFTDYRAVWLDTYYRQQFGGDPRYRSANPSGYNLGGGIRWEYAPTIGIAELSIAYNRDEIAPGYERVDQPEGGPITERGRDQLETRAISFSTENVFSSRIRSRQEFRFSQTTLREVRFSYRGSINIALAETWVARLQGGYARELPQFVGYYFGTTLEKDLSSEWRLSFTGMYYFDTGDFENTGLVSSAAPGLETFHLGIGLRWTSGRHGVRISGGPYFTRYDTLNLGSRPFTNLYRDRNWALLQLAYSLDF